jgi:mono/diheme cytochrome c family protein
MSHRRFQPNTFALWPAIASAGLLACIAAQAQETQVAIYQPTDDIERSAQAIMDKHCARCHQLGRLVNKQKPSKGFGEVMQLDKLAANPNYIVTGNPDGSKLFQMVANKNMPYDLYQEGDIEKPSVTPDDIQVLRSWIEALGKKQASACITGRPYSAKDLIEIMYRDLTKLPDHERANTRYVSIAHLAAACASKEELEVYRQGVVKLLNSLSQNSDVLTLQAADEAKLVIRFNLDDLKWTPELWEYIANLYPYGIKPVNSEFEALAAAVHTQVPYVRGDWLAFFASRPPLYEKILDLADTFQGLEKQLGIETLNNIRRKQIVRAGFKESGVSQHNRLIERHTIATGAFWTSYDFGGTKTRQNLFEFPLGPEGAFAQTGYGDDFAFKHDGGESIFNLPNGFQAYYLNNANGAHLDKGPTTIVRDPDRVDLAVTNGISCMGCHDQGMKNATDDIRSHVTATKIFPAEVRETVKAVYPEKPELDRIIEQDRERFISAMKRAGLDPKLQNGTEEMVNALSNRYERDIDLKSAAAEFGVAPEEAGKSLHAAGRIGASFAAQLEQGTVQRDTFEEEFGGLVESVIDATFIRPSPGALSFEEVKHNEVAESGGPSAKNDVSVVLYAASAQARVGDRPKFTVRTGRDCHLTLINVDKSGEGMVIFPNKFEPDNRIAGDKDFIFPPPDAAYDFKFLDPGVETVIAICDVSGVALAGIQHDFAAAEFTSLGAGKKLSRKIDVVKRPETKKAAKGEPVYSGIGRTAVKIEVR